MFSLVYVSSAVRPFSSSELVYLLTQCRTNNTQRGITGMLLYKDGNFMQALEGDELAVRDLHRKIARDPRHRGLLTLLQRTFTERQFPDWSMGFHNLDDPEVHAIPGYTAFLNTPLTGNEFATDPTRCQKLLLTFKSSR